MYVSIGKAAGILGVHVKTLRRWEASGKVRASRTTGGHRRFDLGEVRALSGDAVSPSESRARRAVIYARVSTAKQRGDLERQVGRLREAVTRDGAVQVGEYKDVASGLNEARRGLTALIRDSFTGKFDHVYVTYPDRIARFGSKTVAAVLRHNGVGVTYVEGGGEDDVEKGVVDDVLAVMTVFCAKVHSRRRKCGRKCGGTPSTPA